jgi:hypothetical protein
MIIIVNPEKIEDITLPENEDKCEYNLETNENQR